MNIIVVTGHSSLESGGVGTHLKLLTTQLSLDKQIALNVVLGKGSLGGIHSKIASIVNSRVSQGLKQVISFFLHIYYLKNRIENTLKKAPQEEYIIHAHDRNAAIAAYLLRDNYNLKIIQTLHAPYYQQYDITDSGIEDSLFQFFLKDFDRNTISVIDGLIAVDDLQKSLVLRDFPKSVSTDKITVIPNAVEDALLSSVSNTPTDEKFIVVARHLHKKNGVEYAIKAMKMVETESNLKMIIIGDGPEKERLTKLINDSELNNQVILKGRLSRAETLQYINNACASIVPSIPIGDYIEATSLTMLETMSLRTPLIATNIGGLKQVLSGENAAFLVPPNDPNAIANAILSIQNDKIDTKLDNAQNLIKSKYSMEIWYDNHMKAYKTLFDS